MDKIDWNALSAIGTILAAIVGVAGIWINLFEKKRRLYVNYDILSYDRIHLSNNTLKSVRIVKMVCFVGQHVVYAEYFEGSNEIVLHPNEMKTLSIDTEAMYNSYYSRKINALCNANEPVVIILHDNYRRKYKIKTGVGIAFFKKDSNNADN